MKPIGFVGLCFALALAVPTVQAQDEPTFKLDIGNLQCDGTVNGTAGSTFNAEADVVLMTEDNPLGAGGDVGAQGYSISLAAEGALSITNATVEGTASDLEPVGRRISGSELLDLQQTTGEGNEGVVIAVVFSTGMQVATLPGEGIEVVAKVDVEGTFPASGVEESGRLVFVDGLQGTGEPVVNAVAWTGDTGTTKSVKPELGECSITLAGVEGPMDCSDAEVSMYLMDSELPAIGEDVPQEVWGFTAPDPDTGERDPLPAAPNARLVVDDTFTNAIIDPALVDEEGVITTSADSANVWVAISSQDVTNPVTGEPADGVQGWSISVEVDGDISPSPDQDTFEILENSVVQEREIRIPGQPEPIVGPGFAVGGLGFDGAELAQPARSGGRKGIVSFAVLSQRQPVTLPRTSSAQILKVRVEPDMPPGDDPVVGRVFVSDMLAGSGEPVPTIATVDRETAPVCKAQPVQVQFGVVEAASDFIRCDPNNDGKVNIADAIWTLNERFRGGPATACPEAADCNNDGMVSDASDAVFALMFLFMDPTMPPPAPFPGCGSDDTITVDDCPPGSTICP